MAAAYGALRGMAASMAATDHNAAFRSNSGVASYQQTWQYSVASAWRKRNSAAYRAAIISAGAASAAA